MSPSDRPEWTAFLDRTDKDIPRSTLSNAVVVLQHDPAWGVEVFYFDSFLQRILVRAGTTTREWRDVDDTRLTVYMQQDIGMLTIPEAQVSSAVRMVAHDRVRHAVRDYVSTIAWDGVNRLEHAFEDFWGVIPSETQPSEYVRAVSANFFLSMMARVIHPGCQVDTMVIFEGPQGIGKSRALRVLGGPWYVLAAESVTHKDFFQVLTGALIAEIGEMDSFSRAETERTKIVISTPVDRYRPTYARHAQDFPRQCIFAGTTNRDDYGKDDTGLRRFHPIRCGNITIASLIAARPQLFAESWHRIRAGESWWLTPEHATRAVQRDRQSEDVWTPLVATYLVGKSEVAIHDILADACKVSPGQMTHTQKLRIGSILRLAGWSKSNLRRDGKQVKTWVALPDE